MRTWRPRTLIPIVLLIGVGCADSHSTIAEDPWIEEARSAASGFELSALDDGLVTEQEVNQGLRLHVACLRNLGYRATVDGVQISIASDHELDGDEDRAMTAAYDECAEGNSEFLPGIFLDAQRLQCLIDNGDLPRDADYADLQEMNTHPSFFEEMGECLSP